MWVIRWILSLTILTLPFEEVTGVSQTNNAALPLTGNRLNYNVGVGIAHPTPTALKKHPKQGSLAAVFLLSPIGLRSLIHKFQRKSLRVVSICLKDTRLYHILKERLPALFCHRTNAEFFCIARSDDAILLHLF